MGSSLNLIWGMMTCIGAATALCAVGVVSDGEDQGPLRSVIKVFWAGAGLFLAGSSFLAIRWLSDFFQGLVSLGDLLLRALRM